MKYFILGDDIVIHEDLVANCYLSLLNYLGVGISSFKTHKSKKFFEFAKKLICLHWFNCSPFPLNALVKCDFNIYSIFNTILTSENKGYSFKDPAKLIELIKNIFKAILPKVTYKEKSKIRNIFIDKTIIRPWYFLKKLSRINFINLLLVNLLFIQEVKIHKK